MKRFLPSFIMLAVITGFVFKAGSQDFVSFSMGYSGNCEPVDITLTNTSTLQAPVGGPYFDWFIDGVKVDSVEFPPTLPLFAGDHTVELYVSDDNGLIGTYSENIQVLGVIDTFLVHPSGNVCPGEEVVLQVGPDPWYVEWDFADGSIFNESTKYYSYTTHIFDDPGTFPVSVYVENECGANTVTQDVIVSQDAVPDFMPYVVGSPFVCPNEGIRFTVDGEYASYLWDFGDGNTGVKQTVVHAFPDQGQAEYQVSLTVTNSCGNSNTRSIMVYISTDLPADAGFNIDYNSYSGLPCPGTDIKFVPYSSGMHSWQFGDGNVSDLEEPVYRFSRDGDYPVTHIITTGCGQTDTVTQVLTIQSNPEEAAWGLGYIFEKADESWGEPAYGDTIMACPGENLIIRNTTYYDGEVIYDWDFGDGTTLAARDASHVYPTPGVYKLSLTARTPCGGITEFSRYVDVNPAVEPVASLGIVPQVICPDETVYFYDDGFNPQNNYIYSIDFGDGTSVSDLRLPNDPELQTLAQHSYPAGGPYDFVFTVKNICGNSLEQRGTISVDPDDTRKPFYYVSNSTSSGDDQPPADWSARTDASDHQFDISIQWPAWQPAYGNTFFIFFWYEGLYIDQEPGQPDGIVQFTSDQILSGEVVTAYVPMNLMGNNTVGMAAGYFCNGILRLDDEPEAWGTLIDGSGAMVPEVPLNPGGMTNIMDVSPNGIIIDPTWNGICNSDLPFGRWYRKIDDDVYAVLEMYDSEGFYGYYMEYRNDLTNWTESAYISSGPFIFPNDPDMTIVQFQDEGCGSYVDYSFIKPTADELEFPPSDDSCPERVQFLSGTFTRMSDDYYDLSVCPGDLVKFQVAGGVSYEWDFGDGVTSTEQFPVHAYAAPGIYDAKVTATNACGRQDILNTTVTISDSNKPNVSFNVLNWDIHRLDSIRFRLDQYFNYPGMIDNNIYEWDFGDGKVSNLPNPVHVYNEAGKYKVVLQVSNGCGSDKAELNIEVKEIPALCEAKYSFTVDGTTLSFNDLSLGSPTAWEWDFGNGDFSNEQNPVYDFVTDGKYYVTLTIFNEQTQCVSTVTLKIKVGKVDCDADFSYLVNPTTGLVKFTNLSENYTAVSWDFGDGTFSDLQDPAHTYSKYGIYPVCLTIIDEDTGCQSTTCKEIFVGPPDTSFIKADFSFFLQDDKKTVLFSDLSAGNPTNWYWTTGDGKIYTTPEVKHTYPKEGIYKVCLVVFDEESGLSDEICKEVVVGDLACRLEADFDFYLNNATMEVKFENKSLGSPDVWFWSFGDGGTSERYAPVHLYKKPGFYLVSLSIYDATNDCMDHYAEFIQVGEVECRAGFDMSINPDTREVKFMNTSTGPISAYFWDFGNGRYSKMKDPVITYERNGVYPVSLTVIDSNLICMDMAFEEIQVGGIDCSAGFDYYVDSLKNTAYFYNRQIGDATQLLWLFGDGTYNTKINPKHKFAAPGYYTVSLNTYNSTNNCMDYYEETILVGSEGQDCRSNFIFKPEDDGLTFRFQEKASGDIQYQTWNFGDGNTSQALDPVHTFPAEGYYLTCLTVYNSFGIPNMKCKWVPVVSETDGKCRTDFMFTVDSTTREVIFNDLSWGEPDTWNWDFGDGNTSQEKNPVHVYAEKGFYTVELKTRNSQTGCVSHEVKLLNVADEFLLKASYTYEVIDPGKKVSGYPVDFVGASSGEGASFEWDFGDDKLKSFTVMDSTSRIVTHYYELPGTYTACLRVSDPIIGQTDVYCKQVTTANAVTAPVTTIDLCSIKTYPNPANAYTNVKYYLPERTFIEITVFDELGRRVETLVRTEKDEGEHELLWDTSNKHTGIYHIKLLTGKEVRIYPMVIAR